MSDPVARQTTRWVEAVQGPAQPDDDPAELFHEASKVTPNQIARQIEGARRLDASPDLQLSSLRSTKRRLGARAVRLPGAERLEQPLSDAIAERRSSRSFGRDPLDLQAIATLLSASYGTVAARAVQDGDPGTGLPGAGLSGAGLSATGLQLRTVPSGGALYPLDLYAAVLRVDDLPAGIYRYDPLLARLEVVRETLERDELERASTYPEITGACAVLVLVAGIFWRARFKYGQRGYRFTLLEAGHAGQNLLLAAAALRLAAVPLGGYYDRIADALLGLDGVNESVVYTAAIGSRP